MPFSSQEDIGFQTTRSLPWSGSYWELLASEPFHTRCSPNQENRHSTSCLWSWWLNSGGAVLTQSHKTQQLQNWACKQRQQMDGLLLHKHTSLADPKILGPRCKESGRLPCLCRLGRCIKRWGKIAEHPSTKAITTTVKWRLKFIGVEKSLAWEVEISFFKK